MGNSKVHAYYESRRQAISSQLQEIDNNFNNDYEIRRTASTDTMMVSNVPCNNTETEETFQILKEKYGWNKIVSDAISKELDVVEEKQYNDANSGLSNLISGLMKMKLF